MFPNIFSVVSADAGVTAALGSSPCRFYPAGEAPARETRPYATWQTISGTPENLIGCAPDIDRYSVQVDVYAETLTAARSAAEAVRDAIETRCHIISWRGENRDFKTRLYRFSFDCDWWVER